MLVYQDKVSSNKNGKCNIGYCENQYAIKTFLSYKKTIVTLKLSQNRGILTKIEHFFKSLY